MSVQQYESVRFALFYQAYADWQYYKAIVFNMADRGDIGEEVTAIEDFTVKNQFWVDEDGGRVCMSLNKYEQVNYFQIQ